MENLPQDPFMLLSCINMLLRDGEYDTLEDLCSRFDRDIDEVKNTLKTQGYAYDESQRQFKAI